MDGGTALWFARSRRDSNDYERMARQRCVMSAMLKQIDPQTVLTNFQSLASASAETIWTDVPPHGSSRICCHRRQGAGASRRSA